ncbi:hypothetical protein AAHC03_010116 [Spirometra sp. Aus1]
MPYDYIPSHEALLFSSFKSVYNRARWGPCAVAGCRSRQSGLISQVSRACWWSCVYVARVWKAFAGRASRIQEIIQLANSNVSELCDRLVWDEEAVDSGAVSSAIKHCLGVLSVSLLNDHMFASVVVLEKATATERSGRSLRTPSGLAHALWQV